MDTIEQIDVKENKIYDIDSDILNILLKDNTTGRNIIWATDNYLKYGEQYKFENEIKDYLITGYKGNVIKPRIKKSKEEQSARIKNKAEVFTPSWICNLQNNLIDESWFGYEEVFNKTNHKKWKTQKSSVKFNDNRKWEDYVNELRLEISCGEAPYLVSRYDTVTGEVIDIKNRIGLLDRKLRIVNENVPSKDSWVEWCIKAYKSIYGYEWQGDNLLLARENLLYTFIDYYVDAFNVFPSIELQKEIAIIISWNLWQMDGTKYVIPRTCNLIKKINPQLNIFGEEEVSKEECYGCKKGNYKKHNGVYCKIMNWKTNRTKLFYKILEGEIKNGK